MPTALTLLGLLQASIRTRQYLGAENLALRHQLAVLKRSVKRPRIEDSDRIFWILMRRTLKDWAECLHFVQPETVLRWHCKGFKYFWNRKSKPKTPGRPSIGWELVHLIRRMSQENVTWGAPRIQSEMATLGHDIAETTVAKCMVRHRNPEAGQRWSAFLRNHMSATIACDFLTVPTVTFKNLFAFVVLHHGSRRILHVNVTAHPTAEWTAQQLVEALGADDAPDATHLIRDRDAIYGDVFRRKVGALGLRDVVTPKASPWCNGFAERVIGTIRRECTDHLIPMGERHLQRVLREFAEYYNTGRCHQSLDGTAPVPRRRQSVGEGSVQSRPVLGGLHHVYSRVA